VTHPVDRRGFLAAAGHGFGMGRRGHPVDGRIDRLGEWLQDQGLMRKAR
jgi:hypothetical protein